MVCTDVQRVWISDCNYTSVGKGRTVAFAENVVRFLQFCRYDGFAGACRAPSSTMRFTDTDD